MRIAVPTWQGRVSPVFDTAQRLLVVKTQNGSETERTEEDLGSLPLPRRASRLRELGVDVLICGAISRPLAGLIAASGTTLIPFVSGECEEVLSAYLGGRLPSPHFLMPGCCGRGPGWRGGFGRGRGRRRGQEQGPQW
ncbi:MAG: NifB/NifX family molybdenum-iron cluster-binding protein [Verrucomicrobia bacterium]|nr:NifB/NifX family molybdenum-iron cluster-binding protein [Verrucomicrobiota bacterium]